MHCPGSEMKADEASRKFKDETEWQLNQAIFEDLCVEFGVPDIDLFASRINCKVQTYCSWKPDPGACFVDSFMCFFLGGGSN